MAKTTKDYLEEYLNKKDFEYDVFKDPVYLALKRSYEDNAEKTAEDLLGKYSQISGGGSVSSRAMSAAASGAASELSKLNDHIPELYELARQMYDDDLSDKEKRYKALLEYDKYLDAKAEKLLSQDKGSGEEEESDKVQEQPVPDDDSEGAEDTGNLPTIEKDAFSKGENGIATGSLAASTSSRHVMDPAVYTMTKRLVNTYMSVGQRNEALALYSKFKNSMSQSQRLEIESILGK